MFTLTEHGRSIHVYSSTLDAASETLARQIMRLPFIGERGMSLMPDVHVSKACNVGTVLPTIKALIPGVVGVDIGCGMSAIRTSLRAEDLGDSLSKTRADIEKRVKAGSEVWKDGKSLTKYGEKVPPMPSALLPVWKKVMGSNPDRLAAHMNTLGGGNHFIELCVDDEGYLWAMLHTGSRGPGAALGDYFIHAAMNDMQKRGIRLDNAMHSYLEESSPLFASYVAALTWAQEFARMNRDTMMDEVLTSIRRTIGPYEVLEDYIDCHHNYAVREGDTWVTRKGAISAKHGEWGIIPGSMGTKSYIVKGKGHESCHCSASHGAGRRLSREEARNTFKKEDILTQLRHIECRKDVDIIDELPGAYKDLDAVMLEQQDLVEVIFTLRSVLCVKG